MSDYRELNDQSADLHRFALATALAAVSNFGSASQLKPLEHLPRFGNVRDFESWQRRDLPALDVVSV